MYSFYTFSDGDVVRTGGKGRPRKRKALMTPPGSPRSPGSPRRIKLHPHVMLSPLDDKVKRSARLRHKRVR